MLGDVACAREAAREEVRLRVLHLQDALEALPRRHDGRRRHCAQRARNAYLCEREVLVRRAACVAADARLGRVVGQEAEAEDGHDADQGGGHALRV